LLAISLYTSSLLLDIFLTLKYFEEYNPISYKSHIGKARSICDITSGGVNNIPRVNAPTIIYGLFKASFSFVVMPEVINNTVTIGTSKENPNAKNNAITKSKYLPISVITATSVGAIPIKKTNIKGNTTKYANAAPR
jgi:hypothetical protein